MRKMYVWTLAAILLICGSTVLTSCSKDDDNSQVVQPVKETAQDIRDFVRTDELIIKNLKTNKVLQISQEIGKVPVLSFGNSSGDCAMHNYCMSNRQLARVNSY